MRVKIRTLSDVNSALGVYGELHRIMQAVPRGAGETGVIGGAGRQWLGTARLLCDCLALGWHKQASNQQDAGRTGSDWDAALALETEADGTGQPSKRQRLMGSEGPPRPAQDDEQPAAPSHTRVGLRERTEDAHLDGGSSTLPAWHQSPAQMRACQQVWHTLVETARNSRLSEDGEELNIADLEHDLLDTLGRTAGLSLLPAEVSDMAEAKEDDNSSLRRLEQAVANKGSTGKKTRVGQLQSLAVAAAYAASRAAALTAVCVGPTHAVREVNAFASCFGRLPWCISSAIVAAADELMHARS